MNLFVFSANLCWSLWNPHSEVWRVHVFGQCYCSPRDFSSFHESWCPPYFARFREIPNLNHENLWQIRQSHHVRPGEGKREKRRPYISCAHRIRQKSEDVKWGNFLLGRSIIIKIHHSVYRMKFQWWVQTKFISHEYTKKCHVELFVILSENDCTLNPGFAGVRSLHVCLMYRTRICFWVCSEVSP